MAELAQDLRRTSTAQGRQDDLARKTDELRKRVDELERKLASESPQAPEEERLRKKLTEAREALARAEQSMQQASQQLGQGREGSAAQERAAQDLKSSEEALAQAEQDALERLRREEEQRDQLASEQKKLERLTRERAEESEDAQASQAMQRAAESMDQASQELQRGRSSEAGEQQDEALAELDRSREQLAQQEEQLASLQQEHEIVDMLGAVEQTIEEQQSILDETVRVDREIAGAASNRAQKITLKKLSDREQALHAQGSDIARRLAEENARVFEHIMRDLLADADEVREALYPRYDPGEYTQVLQREVLARADQLKKALEAELRRRRQNPGQPGQQPQQPPGRQRLVNAISELELLKDLQTQVGDRTRRLEAARAVAGDDLDPIQERMLDRMALQQGSIVELTQKIAEDLRQSLGGEPPDSLDETEVPPPKEAPSPDDSDG